MIIVRFDPTGGNVTAAITITGLVHWYYVFEADGYQFKNDSSTNNPKTHSLGLPHDINDDDDIWEFNLANLTDDTQVYSIKIEWIQDGNVLNDTWQVSGSLDNANNKTLKHNDSAWLIKK